MTATLTEPDLDEHLDEAVPCASREHEDPEAATVLAAWHDRNGHGRDIPLCDRHAGVLLRASDSVLAAIIRCAECRAPVVVDGVRPIPH